MHKTIKGNQTAAKKSIDDDTKWTYHVVTEIRAADGPGGSFAATSERPRRG